MKITISKHTTIDWDKVKAGIMEQMEESINSLIDEAKNTVPSLDEGESATVKTKIGKITIRRAKE